MANIELPKDAEGREIPLDVEVLYDEYGEKFLTDRATYMRKSGNWWFSGHFDLQSVQHRYMASRLRLVRGARKRRPDGCHRSARPMEPGAYPDTGGGGLMDTMEDILADCNEVFRYDETRPQDRAHTYLKEHRVCRGYDDTAMERAAQDMIERAYTVGRMESSKAVARETARIIAEGIAKELGTTPGEEQTCDSR